MPRRRWSRSSWRQLHDHHSEAHEDDIVSIALPAADGEEDIFGLAGTAVDGTQWTVGDCELRFALQSISKVVTYALALEDNGREATLRHVGVEPSGDPFNSITFDDEHQRPHNPMINAGALVAAYLVAGRLAEEKVARILARLRVFTGVRGPRGGHRPARRPARLGRPQPRDQLPHALAGDDRRQHRGQPARCTCRCARCGSPPASSRRLGATLANGGVNPLTGERALDTPPRPRRRQRDDDLRDVRRHRRVGHRRRHPGEERGVGWDRRGDAGAPGARDVLARPRRARQLGARPGRVPRAVERYGLHMFSSPDQTRFGRLRRTAEGLA